MNSNKYYINNQEYAIKYFISQMGIEMIEVFLDSKKSYQDIENSKFLSRLVRIFQSFKDVGDTHLIAYDGKCNNCNKKNLGFTFVGDYSFNYIKIIIDSKNGTLKDMYECGVFVNNDQVLILNRKFFINDFEYFFSQNHKD